MASKAKELFPEPETPVMTTRLLLGIRTSMFLRLCSLAPLMNIASGMILYFSTMPDFPKILLLV